MKFVQDYFETRKRCLRVSFRGDGSTIFNDLGIRVKLGKKGGAISKNDELAHLLVG